MSDREAVGRFTFDAEAEMRWLLLLVIVVLVVGGLWLPRRARRAGRSVRR